MDLEELKAEIETEDDVGKISECIGRLVKDGIGGGGQGSTLYLLGIKYAEELVKSLDLEKLKDKIEAEEDIGKIGKCIMKVALARDQGFAVSVWRHVGVAEKLLKSLDLEKLKDKIEAEEDIGKIRVCIVGIDCGSVEIAEKLLKSLDFEILKDKIEAEENIEKITGFVGEIAVRSEEIAEKLVPVMMKKIEAEEDIEKISKWFRGVCGVKWTRWASKKIAEKLSKALDIETPMTPWDAHNGVFSYQKLKDKINAEEDIYKIWKFILAIMGIVQKNTEEDTGTVGRCCIYSTDEWCKELAEKLIPTVKNKIESEEDAGKIGGCIKSIEDVMWLDIFLLVSGSVSKLVNQLDPDKAKTPEVREKIIGLKKRTSELNRSRNTHNIRQHSRRGFLRSRSPPDQG